jgi:hypothetical protein
MAFVSIIADNTLRQQRAEEEFFEMFHHFKVGWLSIKCDKHTKCTSTSKTEEVAKVHDLV